MVIRRGIRPVGIIASSSLSLLAFLALDRDALVASLRAMTTPVRPPVSLSRAVGRRTARAVSSSSSSSRGGDERGRRALQRARSGDRRGGGGGGASSRGAALAPPRESKRSRRHSSRPAAVAADRLTGTPPPPPPPLVVTPEKPPPSSGPLPAGEGFQDLGIPSAELRPSATLTTGQCFHWRAASTGGTGVGEATRSAWGSHNATEWVGTLRDYKTGESAVVQLVETADSTLYRTLCAPPAANVRSMLHDYFQWDEERPTQLRDLYRLWSKRCDRLKRIAECIPGVRIVDQDPWECLVSFICSSNNNIPRITKMLNAIRREYGERIGTFGDDREVYYAFPSLQKLKSEATEADLRGKCGLGYRAKYLIETMNILDSLGGESYLHGLRSIRDPAVVQEKLMQFCGVGRKVADCVALFSLRQDDAIPIDVHVWNIARRDYDPEGLLESVNSLTQSVYRQVGDLFRCRFPAKSGWAHSLLFVAELPSFRPALADDLVEEMEKFREEEMSRKQEIRAAKQKK